MAFKTYWHFVLNGKLLYNLKITLFLLVMVNSLKTVTLKLQLLIKETVLHFFKPYALGYNVINCLFSICN